MCERISVFCNYIEKSILCKDVTMSEHDREFKIWLANERPKTNKALTGVGEHRRIDLQ